MKEIIINRVKFLDLVGERYFTLPPFQQEHSWDEENWDEFIQSITNFIDNKKIFEANKKRKLNQQKYFAGDVIPKKGHKDNDFSSEIIDHQQRIVTIFILLYVIYENTNNPEIKEILFSKKMENEKEKMENEKEKMEIGIELNNKHDKEELEKALGFSQTGDLIKKNEKKQRDGNILNAKKYFIKFFEAENEYQIQEIYDVITKNFYFALVEIEYDDKVEELFTALNNTGLNLSNADLLKSLLIRKAKTGSEEQVIQTWEKEIVEIITEARKRQTINREMDRFLIDFWLAKFWKKTDIKPTKPTKLNVYRLFESKVTDSNKSFEILNLLADYAEVYKNIKDPDKSWWEKTFWPPEMFYVISDISTLNYSQLFPIILKIHFELEKKSAEERRLATKALETILYYIFRSITVRGQTPGNIPRFVPLIIEEIAVNNKLFNNDLKKEWLEEEFSDSGKEKFYNEFLVYFTERNKIWEFVLKNYYWRKFQSKFEFEQEKISSMDLRQVIYNWKKTNVEHLIPRTVLKKNKLDPERLGEEIIYSLGNVTLVDGNLNLRMSDKVWKKKKFDIKEYGNNCPLNWEKTHFLALDKLTSEDIKKRTEALISEFKTMKLFDVDWTNEEES